MFESKNLNIKQAKAKAQKYIALLKKQIPIEEAYLYGSFAKNSQTSFSDIDICVISPIFDKNKLKDRFLLWDIITRDLVDIEPVGFSQKQFTEEKPLVWEIKQHSLKLKI